MVELTKAKPCDYIRFVLSALILCFSVLVTGYAILMQHTMFWKVVPGYAALIIFIIDLIILGKQFVITSAFPLMMFSM